MINKNPLVIVIVDILYKTWINVNMLFLLFFVYEGVDKNQIFRNI